MVSFFEPSFLAGILRESDDGDLIPTEEVIYESTAQCLKSSLSKHIEAVGISAAVSLLLGNEEIKEEVSKVIFSDSHASLKNSLKGSKSKLTSSKKDRNYLLSLSPRNLCEEFSEHSGAAFNLVIQGLLGISDPATVFESQHLLNILTLIYSTVAKTINRQATGYALLLTTAARDGGLREDSLSIFSCLVHPSTSQKYDKAVLSEGWDSKLRNELEKEMEHFNNQRETERKIEKLFEEEADIETIEAAKDELEVLKDLTPPQLQAVWDNLNLRTKHRYERMEDKNTYADTNLDWMASLWVKDRISANHMDHRPGVSLKDVSNLSIKDMVPSEDEKDYILMSLVHYFAYRLVQRHPNLFKTISTSIKQNRPHQFQAAMDQKSEEFTGNLFTKSESSTEDLITMMSEIQLNVNRYNDSDGIEHCYEKKIVSGDQKTEKNMHFGILSKTDENSESDCLGYLLPAHEYFHQSMAVADCDSELFRDSSRGLEGGAFFVATLLNRKDAKTKKGKDAIDALKDFLLLKADARFCQYFIMKNNLSPDVDNTPDELKNATDEKKKLFLHEKVEEVLKDLLPFFRSCSSSDPQLVDHPLQEGRRARYQPIRIVAEETALEEPMLIGEDVLEKTVNHLQHSLERCLDEVVSNIEEVTVKVTSSRFSKVFRCKLCSFESKYRTVCLAHVKCCQVESSLAAPDLHVDENTNASNSSSNIEACTSSHIALPETNNECEVTDDMYWNYKCSEFFLDAIFALTSSFEKFGDGLGCYIVNKIVLPILHGLKHSNYSNTIHRSITRVLCEATPREGLKLIHERFSNRRGKPGQNISRDRRMEYRIGAAKKLIGNLGPNFSKEAVQQVNRTLDIKEELFLRTRESHGVDIRSGRHNPRSDARDYDLLFSHLTDTKAHVKVEGRPFGDLKFKEDLMDDERFNKVEFYRWIASKNKEAKYVLAAKKR